VLNITSSTAISASYAATASYLENAIPPFPYTGSAVITGSLNVIGPFTASSSLITGNVVVLGTASINTLIVNQRQLSTGSNQLGDAADDTQTLFGSVIIPTGSLTVTGSTFLSGPIFVEDIKPTSNIISIGNAGTDYLFLGVKNPNNLYPFSQYSPFPGIGIYSLDSFASSTRGSVVVSYNSGSSVGNFQVWSVDDDGIRTERLVLSNQGNLGIGTNSPTSKLDVNGTGRFTNNLTITGSVIISGSGVRTLEVDGVTYLNNRVFAPNLTINSSNKTLYFDQDNGEIYVGPTVTESDTLDTVTTRGNTTLNSITIGNLTSSAARITNGLTVTGSAIISGSNATQLLVGTNSLFVSSSGNVGMGTTSPSASLHLVGFQANTSSTSVSNPTGTLILGYPAGFDNGNFGSSIVFTQRWNNGSTNEIAMGQITGVKLNSNGNFGGGLTFWTPNGNTNALTERMRIDQSGNIGIGTTSPTQGKLVILAPDESVSSAISIRQSNDVRYGMDIGLDQTVNGNGYFYAIEDSSRYEFLQFTRSTAPNVLLANSGGNVGIKNTNPNVALDVSGVVAIRGGEAASEARMHFRASDNSNRFTIETDLDPSPLVDLLSFRGNNTSNILVLKGNGDIGMGTTTPTKNVTVNRANASLEIRATNEFESAALFFGNPFVNSTAAPPKAAIIAAGLNTWSRSNLHFCLDDTTTNTEASLSNSRMILTKEGNLAVGIGNTSPISRFQVRGSGTTSATTTFLLQNSTPTTLLSVLDNGQTLFTGPSSTLVNGVAQFNISQSLIQTAVTNSVIDAVRISPTLQTTAINQVQTALKVQATFTGSFTGSQNVIADFGATSVGSQLTVTDITSGSIFMVNDVSGLPIIEATSDWSVRMYNFPNTVFEKTGSNVNIYGTLNATGSFILPLSQSTTPVVGSAYWSGSLLFVYDGTRYRSSSFA
jgi:hypothetical protein